MLVNDVLCDGGPFFFELRQLLPPDEAPQWEQGTGDDD